jgi:hypothetical protein
MTVNGQDADPQKQYGGFEFGSFVAPETHQPAPKHMSDMDRLLAMSPGQPPVDMSDYRNAEGGPLVVGKESLYVDLESLGGDIEVKFGPHELLKANGAQVYMLDTNGVPHFIRPWTPESALKLTSTMITKFQLAAAVILLSVAGLSIFGAFTDTAYVALLQNGKEVTATVTSEEYKGLTGDKAGLFDHVLHLSYGNNASVISHDETSTPSSDGSKTFVGAKIQILVDSTQPNNFAFVRKENVPSWSPFSLFPLLGIGLIAAKWTSVITINRKMKLLLNAPIPRKKN